jgi:hypothetical protein
LLDILLNQFRGDGRKIFLDQVDIRHIQSQALNVVDCLDCEIPLRQYARVHMLRQILSLQFSLFDLLQQDYVVDDSVFESAVLEYVGLFGGVLIMLDNIRVNNCEHLVLIMRLHKSGHPLRKHSEAMDKVAMPVQVLPSLEELRLETLPNKTEEAAVAEAAKERVRHKSVLVNDVSDGDPLVEGQLFDKRFKAD